jgi:hypothetical protein
VAERIVLLLLLGDRRLSILAVLVVGLVHLLVLRNALCQ